MKDLTKDQQVKSRHSQSTHQGARKSVGASKAGKAKVNDKLSFWLEHHQLVAVETLERLLTSPLSSLLTWLVVAIALAMPGLLYMTVNNMQQLTGHLQSSGQMTVFLHSASGSGQQVDELLQQIQNEDFIASSQFISADQALEEFKAQSGMDSEITEALGYLSENPLPAMILVEPKIGTDKQLLAQWQQEISALPQVDTVQADLQWLERLQGMMAVVSQVVSVLAALLALAIVLVIGNTIRLAIAAREDEIRVVKLVGATEAFVRRPFLYTGIWYGLGGALIAVILLFVTWLMIKGPVYNLAALYGAEFSLLPFGFMPSLLLILLAIVLGWLGAWWSVSRHLSRIEP